jgi:hypothetical protein
MKMKKILFFLFFMVAAALFAPESALAQCAMCRAAPSSNLAAGGKDGAGLNKGILYMFLTPYLLVSTMAYLWWRGRKQYKIEAESIAQDAEIQRVLREAEEDID